MEWEKKELSGIKLGDERLNKRSVKLLKSIAPKPSASIPPACGGWSETLAAYRFFGQEGIVWSDILQPHIDCTLIRSQAYPVKARRFWRAPLDCHVGRSRYRGEKTSPSD